MSNFIELSPFVHQYDFPISNYLTPYIDDIIDQYKKHYIHLDGYSMPYFNDEVTQKLETDFVKLITNNYKVSSQIKPIQPHVYYQDLTHQKNSLHNHNATSTLNAVFYLKLPKEGGGIEFIDEEMVSHQLNSPEIDKIYVFPYWLSHRPLPHTSNDIRISFNLEYFCVERPRHYATQKRLVW